MNDTQTKNAQTENPQPADEADSGQIVIPVINENDTQQIVIPVIQEDVKVDKQIVETGSVRVVKKVGEYETLVDEPLLREEVAVERVPINQYVDEAPQTRQEGDTLIIPVVHEEIVVQKRLLVVEELRVQKQIVEEHKPQYITLHKDEVEITRTAKDENPGG
jgi:uncharacterized protein (TIGR02271 family)